MSIHITHPIGQTYPEPSCMFNPSNSIPPDPSRAIMPRTAVATLGAEVPERVNQPAQRVASLGGNPKSAFSRTDRPASDPAAPPVQNPKSEFSRNQPFEPRADRADGADRAARAKPPIRVFPNQPREPRADRPTRAKRPIRVFPNQTLEPRAGQFSRANPPIRVLPNQPLEPRADRAARAKPPIRAFPKQPAAPQSPGP